MFSMLGVNIAYVTAIGKLIGVVGLKELRSGIENANSGAPSKSQTPKTKTFYQCFQNSGFHLDGKSLYHSRGDFAINHSQTLAMFKIFFW